MITLLLATCQGPVFGTTADFLLT